MSKKSQRARAAAKKAQTAQAKVETRTFLTPNDMITEALRRDYVDLLSKRLDKGLLNIDVAKQDPRTAM